MDIVAFRTFLAAAESGSFARAAERVHASPSTVTERIQQLEHRLGARLFERNKRGCKLTQAGKRFVPSAQQSVRMWDIARHDVGLPDRFKRSLAFGGQYILWPDLIGWMGQVRDAIPDLAIRATAGASRRLNRDLAEGTLDMVVLYDPIFRNDVAAEPVFDDQLVLVTGGDSASWQESFVPIEWGPTIGPRIAAQIGLPPDSGLVLDLGERSADWLVAHKASGYLPRRLAKRFAAEGKLTQLHDAPTFDYPIYACWRRDSDAGLIDELRSLLLRNFVEPELV